MAGYVDAAAAQVLSNNELLMSAPSNAKLTSFYPTPAESQNSIAQAVANSGQLFVRANSKVFGSSSDFQVSTANILDAPILSMEITVNAIIGALNGEDANLYVGSWQDGWGFDLIESMEVSYSNSNISNLVVSGQALRDWSLMQCKNKDERQDLLQAAGRLQYGTRNVKNVFKASVPLSFLNWRGAGGVDGGFPFDARTLNGSIQFQLKFRPLGAAIGPMASNYIPNTGGFQNVPGDAGSSTTIQFRGGTDSGLPTEFSNLELTCRTYQLSDSSFSVSHALQANPGLVYSIPAQWLNTYRYTADVTAGNQVEIQLNSAPAGMIQCMMMSVRPIYQTNHATDTSYDYHKFTTAGCSTFRPAHYQSLPLSDLRLQYSGQSIIDYHTQDQLDAFSKFIFCDDLHTPISGWGANGAASSGGTAVANNVPATRGIRWEAQQLILPLMHQGNEVMRNRGFENLPHYSGSTLSLRFRVENPSYKAGPYSNAVAPSAADTFTNPDLLVSGGPAVQTITIPGASASAAAGQQATSINRVEVLITYVVAALFQSANGVAELQL